MKRRLTFLALQAAALFALAISASAQVTTIEGVVTAEDGQPLKGATVKIERKDIKGSYPVKTDKKGHYGHYGLPLGTYKVSIELEGKTRGSMDNIRTKLGDPRVVPFDLKAEKQEQQVMAKAAETGVVPPEQAKKMTAEEKAAMEKALKSREADIKKNKELNDSYTAGKDALTAKNYDAAIENLTKASEIDPKQNVIWSQLAEAYIGQAGTKAGAEQDAPRQKGLDAYAKAIELKPDDAALHNNFGLALVKAKKIPEAQEELSKAATLDPPNAVRYFYNEGAVLINANQNEAAAAAFQKAIASYNAVKANNPPEDIKQNFANANYQFGVTLLSKAQTDIKTGKVTPAPGTVEAFNTYLELQPNGQFANEAKGLLASIGGTVSTTYKNPDAPETKKKGKK